MNFYHLQENIKKQLLNTGLYAAKLLPKKRVQKAGEFIGVKIADAVTKLFDDKIVKQKPVEKVIIPQEKRDEILSKFRRAL